MNKLRFDSVKPKITIDEVNARNDLSFILKLHLKDEILHEFNNILKPYFLLTSNYGNPDFDFNKEKMIEIAKALTNTTSNLIDFIKKTDLLFE